MTRHKIEAVELTYDLLDEIYPILEMHRAEILPYEDMAVNVDWEMYMKIDQAGAYQMFTARTEDGELVGYISMFMAPALIDKRFRQAQQDGLFIHPDHRHGMLCARMIKFVDEWLTDEGINYTAQRVHKGVDYSPILLRMGYEYTEAQYTRRLN